MKYRLVKKYPGSPELGYEPKFNNNGEDWNTPNMLIVADCKDFPEFWEEVKEPLFITTDNKEIFEGDIYYFIVENDKEVISTAWTIQAHKADANCKKFCPLGRVQFSGYKTAEKYIEQNKPRFSVKDVEGAVESSYKRETYYIVDLGYDSIQIDRFKEDLFKQKLGI